jgi:hypothetical protein
MSLVAGYALWIVSDEMLGLSGMLSLVFFATALGAFGKYRISRSVTESFTFFWEWVDWLANTLIFFLSGLIIAIEFTKISALSNTAWGWGVALWLFLLAIRTVMVVLFYPVLRLGQYGLDWKDCLVLSWAGLRGAVGLTLALIVYYSDNVLDQSYREHFLFFVGFIAFLTLTLQGSTTSILLKYLGFLKMTPAMKSAQIHAAGAVDRLGAAKIADAQKVPSLLGEAEWKKVKAYTKLDLAERVVKRSRVGDGAATKKKSILKHIDASLSTEERERKRSFVHDMRERLLQMVHALYKDAFAANYLSPDESLTLYESVEKSLDTIEEFPLSDWTCLEEKLTRLEKFERIKLEAAETNSALSSSSMSKIKRMWQKTKNFFVSPMRKARSDAETVHAFICSHAQARRELKVYIDIEFAVASPTSTGIDNALNFDLEAGKPPMNIVDGGGGEAPVRKAEVNHQPRGDDVPVYWREDSNLPPIDTSANKQTTSISNSTKITNFPLDPAAAYGIEDGITTSGFLDQHAADLARSLSTIQRMTTRDKNIAANIQAALSQVLEESRSEQALAEAHLQKLKELCPKAVQNLRTAHVSMRVLKEESEFLERLHAMGLLEDKEVGPVLKQVERRIQRLNLADYESLPFLKPELGE